MRQGESRRRSAPDLGIAWNESPDSLADSAPLEPTALHALRIESVCGWLMDGGLKSVADLGCGDGLLVHRLLAHTDFHKVVGVDISAETLLKLERERTADIQSGRLHLVHGSFTERHRELLDVEAVAMVETIEHIPPTRLSRLEHWVFAQLRPSTVVITTPNQEYNVLFGMSPGQMREAGHCFEWPRARFRQWVCGVAMRHGYALQFHGIGEEDSRLGSPTQAARFERLHTRHPSQ
ncbi:MAG: methyltransferase domain-containing protein [Polaromonas sp.]|nr:methyltransferase domain-containing protein [Polaromonas sp.]